MQFEKVYEGNLVEILRVAPNVYFRKANLGTRGQCNGAFLVGETGVAVVDVPTPEGAQELMDEAQRVFHKPIRYIFITHGHGDHVGGLPLFLDQDVTIFCARRLLPALAPEGRQYKATFMGVEGTLPFILSGGLKIELFTLPDITHSPGDMFVRVPDAGVLCTGDAAVEYQTLYYHTASAGTWISSLRQLVQRNDQYVLPGHGDVYPYSYIGEVADFITVVQRAAQHCFDSLSDEEISRISVEKVNALIADYFTSGNPDAAVIVQKAGNDAQREVRMVLWPMIREEMR